MDPPKTAPESPCPDPSDPLPARMLNEFINRPQLFYYEHVEGVLLPHADTKRGAAGKGALPVARPLSASAEATTSAENPNLNVESDVIQSRSVSFSSDRLGVITKMDPVEIRTGVERGFCSARPASRGITKSARPAKTTTARKSGTPTACSSVCNASS